MSKNDLQTLKELAQVVTKNKVKSIDVLSKKGPDTKIFDFYDRLLKDSFENDEEAASYYYKDDSHHPQYRKLKNRLKEKLINTAFFIDTNVPKFNTHQKAFYTCQKNLMAVKILLGRYARTPAIEIAQDTLRTSERFEFSEVSLELCRVLRNHYAFHAQSEPRYRKYANLAKKYEKIVAEEDLVLEMYDETSILLKKLAKNKKKVIQLCDKFEKQLLPIRSTNHNFKFHLWYFFLLLRRDTLKSDYRSIINLCDRAIGFLGKKAFISDHFIGAFYYNKLMATIQIGDFVSGQLLAEKCSTIFEENTIRWFNAQEFCLIFALHASKYRKALSIRERVVGVTDFKNQFQNRQETWRLYDA